MLTGFIIGVYDGALGPGTGSFIVFALVGLLGYAFLEASAKAKIANFATNLGALTVFVPGGHVLWKVGAVMAVMNIAGGYIGARTAVAKGSAFVRAVFIVVLVAFIIRIGGSVLGRLELTMGADTGRLLDRLVALAGLPGAASSSASPGPRGRARPRSVEDLLRAAGLPPGLAGRVAHVPMDGFHLTNAELDRLGRRDRKGAPDTFDAAAYAALLAQPRAPRREPVAAPAFDHAAGEPVPGAITVPPGADVVLTEGNYPLLDEGDWARVRPLLDEVVLRPRRRPAPRPPGRAPRRGRAPAARRARLGAHLGRGQRPTRGAHLGGRRPGPGGRAGGQRPGLTAPGQETPGEGTSLPRSRRPHGRRTATASPRSAPRVGPVTTADLTPAGPMDAPAHPRPVAYPLAPGRDRAQLVARRVRHRPVGRAAVGHRALGAERRPRGARLPGRTAHQQRPPDRAHASALLLVQVLLMARVPWLEQAWGAGRPRSAHRTVGVHLVQPHVGAHRAHRPRLCRASPQGLWGAIVDLVLEYPGMPSPSPAPPPCAWWS